VNCNEQANVSVIIPCYCCTETVERALLSVLQQTISPVEIILVDDASNDDGATLNCLRELCLTSGKSSRIPIRLITLQENAGPSGARNVAWDTATADFIAFLDADDAWHPKKIEIQYTWMAAHPKVALSGHRSCQKDVLLPSSEVISQWSVKACNFRLMLFKNPLMTRTVMMRRDTPLRFVEDKRYAEDYLLWLQSVALGLQACVLDAVLAYSFKPEYGASGLGSNLWSMERGVLDNFRRLYRDRTIGKFIFLTASIFSFIKYLRRMIIVVCRRAVSGEFK